MLTLDALADLVRANAEASKSQVREFSLGRRQLAFNSGPAIMGVVNLSPGSWYRESVCLNLESALERAKVLSAQGAAVVDIGAESTLAHTERVDAAEQNRMLLPVVAGLTEAGIPVSVETYEPAVARACLEAGAAVVNLTGAENNQEIFRIAAAHDAAVIICYVQGRNVREVADFDLSRDPVPMLLEYFAREVEAADRAGLRKVFIDPGLGFYYRNLQDSSLRIRHQMNLFLNTFRFRTLGVPVCNALPHAFEFFREEVRSAEPFFAVLAALGKTDLFRTHEVPRIRAVLRTLGIY